MARPAQPLKKRYGKLTVHGSEVIAGRRWARVSCTCGTHKAVLADALRSGRAQSCGAPACRRTRAKVKPDPSYKPRGPAIIRPHRLRWAWGKYTDPEHPMSAADLARHFAVNYNSMYSVLRNVRKAGGIDEYLSRIQP